MIESSYLEVILMLLDGLHLTPDGSLLGQGFQQGVQVGCSLLYVIVEGR